MSDAPARPMLVRNGVARAAVILPPDAYTAWLNPSAQTPELLSWLKPFPAEAMTAYPVSRLVNSPANDLPDCILPATS